MHLQPPSSSIMLYSDYEGMHHANELNPRQWFRSERLKTVTAIGACVDPFTNRITWLIFYHEQSVTYLGDSSRRDSPLKFPLGKGEEIIAVAHGVEYHGIQVFLHILRYLRLN